MSGSEHPDTSGFVASPDDITEVFQRHFSNYKNTSGEVAYQQFQNEESIRVQYSGRVLFELLQNALDRADSNVHVEIREVDWGSVDHALVVGNDGTPIQIDPEYDYGNPPETRNGRRPDFNALCSVHTSNKLAEESVGNKGIGFRSVFWLGDYVRVWSRFADSPGWWGLEMHSPLDQNVWTKRLQITEVRAGHQRYLDSTDVLLNETDQRPSFHFPLPLDANQPPTPTQVDDLNTVVVVPILESRFEELLDSIATIQKGHLKFVGLFEDRREIQVNFTTLQQSFSKRTWPKQNNGDDHSGQSITHWKTGELESKALEAELELSEPGAAVAWPEPISVDNGVASRESNPRVYGYLPTLIGSPFGIDVQGDFQLRTDRTGLRLDDEKIGSYNRALLRVAAELHLYKILMELETLSDSIDWNWIEPSEIQTVPAEDSLTLPRQDLWTFLNPNPIESGAGEVVVEHLESLLFPDVGSRNAERYQFWAELATAFFDSRDRWPIGSYREFWKASEGWIDRACQYSSGTKTWRKTAAAMGDALRTDQSGVAPVTSKKELAPETHVPAVPLPERADPDEVVGRGARHTRRLFLRRSEETDLELPRALRAANRAVTSFDFPPGFSSEPPQPLGADQFNRWDVLQELRQLPHDIDTWSYTPLADDEELAIELQGQLISFAMDLYALDSEGGAVSPAKSDGFGPGWRALRNKGYSDNARTAGRSIATLFLPNTAGKWEPARQLTLDRVAVNLLPDPPSDVDLEEFLIFLGVSPAPPEDGVPVTLVEGGEDGIATEIPPSLMAAGSQWSPVKFGQELNIDEGLDPEAWLRSLDDAWDWLEELLAAELEEIEESEGGGRRPLELIPELRDQAWFPVGSSDLAADPPVIVEDPPTEIAPSLVTLVSRQQRQFPAVLWSLSKESTIESELLTALGAIPGTDIESLGQQNAEPAFKLLEQLHEITASNLGVLDDHPRVRQALSQLFDRLINTIAREHDPADSQPAIPLLVYEGTTDKRALSDRPLKWTEGISDVWIPTDTEEREQMRRFFPDVPIVAATVGRNTLTGYEPLADHTLEITRYVHPAHKGSEEVEVVATLEEKLSRIIPHLLALAETTNQVEVDPAAAADRWRGRVIRYVDDAWIEFEANLGDDTRLSDPQFKGTHNHAIFLKNEPPTVIFDTPSGREDHPPLDEFGEPLAKLLLEEKGGGAGPTFAHALGAFESGGIGRLERILKKHDAMPLVDAYERHLRQLDGEEFAELRTQVREALEELGIELRDTWTRLSHIGPDDIVTSDTTSKVTSHQVNETLRAIELTDDQEPFRPQFSCVEHHRKTWDDWRSSWEDRLFPYLESLLDAQTGIEISEMEIENRVDEYVQETACRRVGFEPNVAVINWLQLNPLGASIPQEKLPSPDQLKEQLIEFSPRYDSVEEVVTSAEIGLERPVVKQGDPNETEGGVVELEDLKAEWEQTKAVGDEAERAARTWIVNKTADNLNRAESRGEFEAVCDLLVSAIPGSGKTVETLQNALREWYENRNRETLERGLHVSQTWDGVGYDMIGLEETSDGFEPVRYEVKSLPDPGAGFKIHLTRNQLRVYRKVRIEDHPEDGSKYEGDWKLLGVEPDGRAVDLTSELDGLPSLLRTLQTEGYDHDGLLIYIGEA